MSGTEQKAVLDAADHGNLAELERLLEENPALVDCADRSGWTPLHYAAFYGYVKMAKVLLEKGAATDVTTRDGTTPLHYAAMRGRGEMVKTLLEKGAATEAKTDDGTTPLHYAAFYGYVKMSKALLEMGAATEAKTNDGDTPLHKAAGMHQLACMVTLLEAGADMNAATTGGDTPAARALAPSCFRKSVDVDNAVGILLAAGGSMPPGVSMSPSVAAAAYAHAAIRAASLSDAAVADAERRIRLALVNGCGCVGAWPHLAARMLRDGCDERRTITSVVMAKLPEMPDMAAWRAEQQQLDAAGAAAAPAALLFVTGMFVSRAAVQLAFARVRRDAVSAARIDAAGRSIAALGEAVKMTESSGDGSSSVGAATAYDKKALYAAVRCIGRWGELSLEATAADTEVASALQRLEEARSSAEAAEAALGRLQPQQAAT